MLDASVISQDDGKQITYHLERKIDSNPPRLPECTFKNQPECTFKNQQLMSSKEMQRGVLKLHGERSTEVKLTPPAGNKRNNFFSLIGICLLFCNVS